MRKVKLIVACSLDLTIGNNGSMPWCLPKDLKYFKEMTEGHTVIMGRKCWESIPDQYRPLSNRDNIVLSRNESLKLEGAKVVVSITDAIEQNGEYWIIGGAEIYRLAMPYVDEIYLTKINEKIKGDTKLDSLNYSEWILRDATEWEQDGEYKIRFEKYTRKSDY